MGWLIGDTGADTSGDILSVYFANKGREDADKAYSSLDNVDTKRKSVQDLYKEGAEAAGQAAGDKAGIAKRQAKAAALMNGAGKMQAAVQGAQAAADAVSEGYDATQGAAAGLAGSQNNAELNAKQNLAQTKAAGLAQSALNEASQKSAAALSYSNSKNAAKDRGWARKKDLLSLGASFAAANK